MEPVSLRDAAQQVARACHQELLQVLEADGDGIEAALQRAQGRLLRLSVLLGFGLEPAIEAQDWLETNEGEGPRLAQRAQLAQLEQKRHELCQELATRQPPTDVAAGLLQGMHLDGCLGVPAMVGDLIAGRDRRLSERQHAQAARRLRLGARAALAQSRASEAREELAVSSASDPGVVRLRAPGAFALRLQFDLSRWVVLGCSLDPQGVGGLMMLPEDALCQQLQAVADESEDQDKPAVLVTAAHAFCSHVWLRASLDEALHASSSLCEVSSASWDRRGVVSLRTFPEWDPTCGGICSAERFDPGSGCVLELHKRAGGGIRPVLLAGEELPLTALRPSRLVARGPAICLDEVLREARAMLARRLLSQLKTRLLEEAMGKKYFQESQLEMPDGQPLRCLLRGCQIYIDLDVSGRLALSTSGFCEHRPPKAAGGHGGFLERLEAFRTAALREAAEAAVAAVGWRLELPATELAGGQAEPGGAEHLVCRADDLPVAVEFDLADSEVTNLRLVLEGGSRIHAVGIDDFCFAGGDRCAFRVLREGLRCRLTAASELGAGLGCEVLVTAAQYAKTLEDCEFRIQSQGACQFEMSFKEALVSPFTSPLRFEVQEQPPSWRLRGRLRSSAPLIGVTSGALPSGGLVNVQALSDGLEARIEFGEVALRGFWRRWASELPVLARLNELRAEELEDPRFRVVLSRPDCLRFRLAGSAEVFALVPAIQEEEVYCSFQWLEPRRSFLLAQRLSKRLSRAKTRLKDCLCAVAAAAEMVRCVEDVVGEGARTAARSDSEELQSNVWSCRATATSTIQVRCRDMAGVELSAVEEGMVRVTCLSRRPQPDGQHNAVIANLEPFIQFLQSEDPDGSGAKSRGDAPGRNFQVAPGTLGKRLSPLWAYLRSYLTLLQLYLLNRQAGTECLSDLQPTTSAEWPATWARLTVPLRMDVTAGFELVTEAAVEEGGKRRRLDVPKTLPRLRFFSRVHSGCGATEDVFQRLGIFFGRFLAPKRKEGDAAVEPNWEKQRASRLHPILQLLTAPRLWILREAVKILPPLCRAAAEEKATAVRSPWQPLVEQISLRSDGTKALAPRCQLDFVLASKSRCSIRLVTTLRAGASSEAEGWEQVQVEGKGLQEWLQSSKPLPGRSMRPWMDAAALKPPYFLNALLPALLDVLTNSRA